MNNNDYNEIFSKNLRHYLSINNMTQAELASKLHVSAQSVTNWCKGNKSPRMGKVQQIADIFGILKSDLIDDHTNSSNTVIVRLTSEEYHLFKLYNSLNEEGKNMIQEHASYISSQPKYIAPAAEKMEA